MKGLLFTYALTYGGAAFSLFNPFVGLLIYICFAIIRPEALWHWSVPAGNYSRIIGLALLAGWAINGFGNWSFGKSRAIVFSLLGVMGWMALSAVVAYDQDMAWGRVENYAKMVLPFLVGMTTIHSIERLTTLTWVILASEGYLALELNRNYMAGIYGVDNWLSFADLDNNGVAITMVAAAGLAFFFGLREPKFWRRWMCFALAGMTAHVVLFSNSRGGMLALLITGVLSFLLVERQPRHYAYLLLAVAVGLRLAGPAVIERFSTIFVDAEERDTSAKDRLGLSLVCIQMMQDQSAFGVGPGNFHSAVARYGYPKGKDGHTTWLQFGAETGIIGMILLLSFYLLTIGHCWWVARSTSVAAAHFARPVIASLVGFMVAAQFVTMYGVEMPYYVALIGASAVKLASLQPAQAKARSNDGYLPYEFVPYLAR
jgi:O-antigen ligase